MSQTSHLGSPRPRVSSILILITCLFCITLTCIPFAVGGTALAAALPATTPTLVPAPPTVVITSPVNNAIYSTKAQIPIIASVNDIDPNVIVNKVEFYSGTTLIGTATAAPYSISLVAQQPGIYTLTAKAYDNYNRVTTSLPINIFVAVQDPLPPPFVILSATAAAGSSFSAPANIVLSASVSDPGSSVSKVDFYNGSTLLGTVTTAPYRLTWGKVPAGVYTLTAVATDMNSGLKGSSAPITVNVLSGSTPTPTPIPSTCKVSYQLSSQWAGGFSATIVITNTGTTSIHGWTLAFTFPGDQRITNLWNGQVSQTGKQVTIRNANWNGTIARGGNVTLGFNGTWTSNNTNPTSFSLNGQVCQ